MTVLPSVCWGVDDIFYSFLGTMPNSSTSGGHGCPPVVLAALRSCVTRLHDYDHGFSKNCQILSGLVRFLPQKLLFPPGIPNLPHALVPKPYRRGGHGTIQVWYSFQRWIAVQPYAQPPAFRHCLRKIHPGDHPIPLLPGPPGERDVMYRDGGLLALHVHVVELVNFSLRLGIQRSPQR